MSLQVIINNMLYKLPYCSWPVFPAPLVKEIVFTPLYILASFVKDKSLLYYGKGGVLTAQISETSILVWKFLLDIEIQ